MGHLKNVFGYYDVMLQHFDHFTDAESILFMY
jgi:hypothetical protein